MQETYTKRGSIKYFFENLSHEKSTWNLTNQIKIISSFQVSDSLLSKFCQARLYFRWETLQSN